MLWNDLQEQMAHLVNLDAEETGVRMHVHGTNSADPPPTNRRVLQGKVVADANAIGMLWGLALETALKARILQLSPEKVRLSVTADGRRGLLGAQIDMFGTSLEKGHGHDLVALAKEAGVYSVKDNPLFKEKQDILEFHETLEVLTETVLWSGRYPVPKGTPKTPKCDDMATIGGPSLNREIIIRALDELRDETMRAAGLSVAPREPDTTGGESITVEARGVAPPSRPAQGIGGRGSGAG